MVDFLICVVGCVTCAALASLVCGIAVRPEAKAVHVQRGRGRCDPRHESAHTNDQMIDG